MTTTTLRKTPLAAALALAAALLAGCGALPERPQRATLYDFGAGPLPNAASAATVSPAQLPPMLLPHIDAPARLDGAQILYRLGYSDPNELRPYSLARWSVPPTRLLEQRLREALAQRRVVLGAEEGTNIARVQGKVPNSLRLTLEEFSQYFESAGSSS